MKKILAFVMAMAMMVTLLAGCGGKKVTLKILDTEYALEDYAICIAKENTALLDEVNKALEELIADGTVQAIIEKYIPAN